MNTQNSACRTSTSTLHSGSEGSRGVFRRSFARIRVILRIAIIVGVAGCSSMNNRDAGALSGAVAGGAIGGVVGSSGGNTAGGVAGGAAAGALAGAIVGAAQDEVGAVRERDDPEKILELQEKELERQDRELQDIKRQEYYDERLRRYEAAESPRGEGDEADFEDEDVDQK